MSLLVDPDDVIFGQRCSSPLRLTEASVCLCACVFVCGQQHDSKQSFIGSHTLANIGSFPPPLQASQNSKTVAHSLHICSLNTYSVKRFVRSAL